MVSSFECTRLQVTVLASRLRWLNALLVLWLPLLIAAGQVSAFAADGKRVMLLYSFGRDFKPWSEYARTIRSELDRQSPWPLDVVEYSLVSARAGDNKPEVAFVEYLRSLYADTPPDLVIAFGAPAAAFIQKHRTELFPATPMILTAVDDRRVQRSELTSNDAVVAVHIDYLAALKNILLVLPDTREIAVVIGTSPIEQFWRAEIGKAEEALKGQVKFRWYDGMTLAQIVQDTSTLPPDSAIFWELLIVDGAGMVFEGDVPMAKVHKTSKAPIFSYDDSFFGQFIVGGPLLSVEIGSEQAAAVAVRILKGERPDAIQLSPVGFSTPKFDWRELHRWGIREANLPAGSEILFREPSAWETYRAAIVTVLGVIMLQAALIGLLLYERRRRQQSEAEAVDLSGKLIGAQEEERSRMARELHDDITQRLAALSIRVAADDRKPEGAERSDSTRSTLTELQRLAGDVHALSYRLHPSILTELGHAEALASECEKFAGRCSTHLDTDIDRLNVDLPKDVALALFRIAQEALRNIEKHASAANAKLVLRKTDNAIELTITDDGIGFESDSSGKFRSLGHASMRQRMRSLNGQLEIRSTKGQGTTVRAWVPLASHNGLQPLQPLAEEGHLGQADGCYHRCP